MTGRVVLFAAAIVITSCSQRLDIGTVVDASMSDAKLTDAALGDSGLPDASLDATVDAGPGDAGLEDCPRPVLLGSLSHQLPSGKGKVLRYSLQTESRCEDLVLDTQGVYASYSRGEQMFVAVGGVIRRVHPDTGATRWQHNYIDDYPNARQPTIFEVDFPNDQKSVGVAVFNPLMANELDVFYFLDPETGAERAAWTELEFFPSSITGFAPHPDGGPRLLGTRRNLFGLAEFELETVGRAKTPYLVEQDIAPERFRSYKVGGDVVVLWISSGGFRYSRVQSLASVSPLGPVTCGNLECTIQDVVPDPVDPDQYYVACWNSDLVTIDVRTSECKVAIARADDENLTIQALSLEP